MAAATETAPAPQRALTGYELLEQARSMLADYAPSMWRNDGESREEWAARLEAADKDFHEAVDEWAGETGDKLAAYYAVIEASKARQVVHKAQRDLHIAAAHREGNLQDRLKGTALEMLVAHRDVQAAKLGVEHGAGDWICLMEMLDDLNKTLDDLDKDSEEYKATKRARNKLDKVRKAASSMPLPSGGSARVQASRSESVEVTDKTLVPPYLIREIIVASTDAKAALKAGHVPGLRLNKKTSEHVRWSA